jgi:hypothetical protein
MKRLLIVVAVVGALVGAAFVAGMRVNVETDADSGAVGFTPPSTVYAGVGDDDDLKEFQRLAERSKVRPETRRVIGRFQTQMGVVELLVASTKGGQTCLIDIAPSRAEGTGCSDGPLFADGKVEWTITSDGGPDRFSMMYLAGVVSPGVSRIVVLRSDGSEQEAQLNSERAFVFSSTADELARDVLPAGFRAYNRGGRLVDSEDIPRLGG